MRTLGKLDVNEVTRAIEDDAGRRLSGLRESLAQAKAGKFSRVHTPEQIVARRPSSVDDLSGDSEGQSR